MSLVWGLIAGFLYAELLIVLLFVLPIFSAPKWARFFRSRFFLMIRNQIQLYFYLLVGLLVLFFLEAIREMRKYSHNDPATESHLNVTMQHSMRLFRAQRNFYIAGFAIFLTLVIKKFVHLNLEQANLLAQAEASFKQAQSATAAARTMMAGDKKDDKKGDKKDDGENKEVAELIKKVVELEKELVKEKKDKEAVKSQAESLNKEYDRLTEEYSKLQRKVTISSGGKDD